MSTVLRFWQHFIYNTNMREGELSGFDGNEQPEQKLAADQEKIQKQLERESLDEFITPQILERLVLLDVTEKTRDGIERSHFSDMIEMIQMVDGVLDRIQKETAYTFSSHERTLLKAGILFQDIGKAATPLVAALYTVDNVKKGATIKDVLEIVQQRGFVSMVTPQEESEIEAYVVDAAADLHEEVAQPLPMRALYDAHSYHSVRILDEEKEKFLEQGVTEEDVEVIRAVAGAHHSLQGLSRISEEFLISHPDINKLAVLGELLDKFQAARLRSGLDTKAAKEDIYQRIDFARYGRGRNEPMRDERIALFFELLEYI